MKRSSWALLVAALVACGKDATAPTPSVSAPDLAGRWTLQIGAAPGCWAAGPLWFEISQEDANSVVGKCGPTGCATGGGSPGSSFINIVSSRWSWLADFSATRPITGNANLTDRTISLRLWKTFPSGGEFSASILRNDSLAGVFLDLNNGFALAPGCAASATAIR